MAVMDDMWIEQLPDDEHGEQFTVIVALDQEAGMLLAGCTQHRIGPLRKTSLIDWLRDGGVSEPAIESMFHRRTRSS
jgi:hypothetical protein